MSKRTLNSKKISDKYELTNFIVNSLNKNYINKLKLGDTNALDKYINTVYDYDIDTDTFSEFINNINQSEKVTISDQLLNMFVNDYLKDNLNEKSLINYFNMISKPDQDISGFELFVKTWIIIEKAMSYISFENNIVHKKYFVPNFETLNNNTKFSKDEISELQNFRKVRNKLLHGIETPPNEYLNESYLRLRQLAEKLIQQVQDAETRKNLDFELRQIDNST